MQETISSNNEERLANYSKEPIYHGSSSQNQQQQQKFIADMYHRLLECFANLVASASSQILRSIFNDVIVAYLFHNQLSVELKLYLYKISEKIISICQGDLNLTPYFIQNMIQHMVDN